jgi:hypothetical protein
MIQMRGIVANVTASVSEGAEGFEVDVTYWMGRASGSEIYSVYLVYDDGSGEEQFAMQRGWDSFIYTAGPFADGTILDMNIVVTTKEGQVYTIGEQTLILGTVTNTTSTGGGIPLDMTTLLIVGGVGIGIVVLVVVIVKFRK